MNLYDHPEEYNLEHLGDDEDIGFYLAIARRLRPQSILELGCGTGRITIPLARQGVRCGYRITGLDNQAAMLRGAEEQCREASAAARERLRLVEGDMREWGAEGEFDLILAPCSSLSHLHSIEDQLATWRRAYANLRPGGRLLVDVTMPNMAVFADSFCRPPRELVEIDIDNFDPKEGIRLLRRKTTRYLSDQQRAQIRFLYEKYHDGRMVDCYVDDFASHVFFPRELELLFMHTGFRVEEAIGDYQGRPLRPNSPFILMIGRRT